MDHARSTLVMMTLLTLTSPWLWADETTTSQDPLSILDDCIKAAEAGDFERYVNHLAVDEMHLQTGYILYMTKMLANNVRYAALDPESLLMTRTMNDLIAKHVIPPDERKPPYQDAAAALTRLGATGLYSGGVGQPTTSGRERCMKTVGILNDPRLFLIDALTELARPTSISGEQVPNVDQFFEIDHILKLAKEFKWTVYTRSEYAVARVEKAQAPNQIGLHEPRAQVEFRRIDGRWMITRLLPAELVEPGNRMAVR